MDSSLARPYAKAAFAYASQVHEIEAWGAWLQGLVDAVDLPEVGPLLHHPLVSRNQLKSVFSVVPGTPAQTRFVHVLIDHGRLSLAQAISVQFSEMACAQASILPVDVITAHPQVPDEHWVRLKQVLEQRTQKTIALRHHVMPSLIGGALLRMGDHVIDGSLRGKLQALKTQFHIK